MTYRRRLFDLVVGIPLLVVSIPLQIIVAIAVRFSSRGPVLYKAVRTGRGGHEFVLHKFRSMVSQPRNAGVGRLVTVADDARITRVGRWIRLLKLDELPQLWNVVSGNMGLVGPRPEQSAYVRDYTTRQRQILAYRPGITSPASILMRREEEVLVALGGDPDVAYRQMVLPAKLEIDLAYFECANLPSDIRVLLRTLASIVRPQPVDVVLAQLTLGLPKGAPSP